MGVADRQSGKPEGAGTFSDNENPTLPAPSQNPREHVKVAMPPSADEAAHARDYDTIPEFESKPLGGRGAPWSNMSNRRK